MKNPKPPKPIAAHDLHTIHMVAGREAKISKVIDTDGDLKEWVGIGWIVIRRANGNDYRFYPRVIDDEPKPKRKDKKCGAHNATNSRGSKMRSRKSTT